QVHQKGQQGFNQYFQRKGVGSFIKSHYLASGYAYGTSDKGKFKGNYIQLPLVTLEGNLTGYQRLYDNGQKEFIGQKKGSFVLILPKGLVALPDTTEKLLGLLDKDYELGLCEGVATGLSICMARPKQIMICALDAGNLEQVAFQLRKKYGYQRQIKKGKETYIAPITVTLWADNDCWTGEGKDRSLAENTGQIKAHKAALDNKMRVRSPNFSHRQLNGEKPTDFNDLHALVGLEAINKSRIVKPDPAIAYSKDLAKLAEKAQDRYLQPLPILQPNSALLVKSPRGTGKTNALAEQINLYKALGFNVLAIGHRKSLMSALSERLGVENYEALNAYDLAITPHLAICFDSLHKLALHQTLPHYDVIILDESEQIFRHITGRHIKHKKANLKVFEHYLKQCPRLILLDAHLGKVSSMALKQFAPEKNLLWHDNYYQIGQDKEVHIPFNREDALEACLFSSVPVFYSTNSIKRTRAVSEYLKHHAPLKKVLVVNSETSSRPEVKAYLESPTREAPNYDILIASPSIVSGLSDESGHWQRVVGDYPNGVGTYQDHQQALGRARGVKRLIVYADPKRQTSKTYKQVLEGYEEADKLDAALHGLKAEQRATKTAYSEFKAFVESVESQYKANGSNRLIKALTLEGHSLDIGLPEYIDSDTLGERKSQNKELKKLELERYASDRADAAVISDERAKAIKDSDSRTEQEIFEFERYEIVREYCLAETASKDEVKNLLIFDEHGKMLQKIRRYEESFKPLDYVKAAAAADLEQNNLLTDTNPLLLRHEFYLKLSEAIDLNEATEAKAKALKEQMGSLKSQIEQLEQQRKDANTVVKGKLDQQITLLETELANLETRNDYHYDKDSIKLFTDYCIYNYAALDSCRLKLPQLNVFKSNPLRALANLLSDMGLSQTRVGRNEKGTYTLDLTRVAEMAGFSCPRREKWHVGQQNVLISSSYNNLVSHSEVFASQTEETTNALNACLSSCDLDQRVSEASQTKLPDFDSFTTFSSTDIDVLERETRLGDLNNRAPWHAVIAALHLPVDQKLIIYPQIIEKYGLTLGDGRK
ncbi:MAG: hypothetical protein KC422_24975, partial [Trueperaceae bacterium]|nr:hypothetical protein [Trueperaceae bacterium]